MITIVDVAEWGKAPTSFLGKMSNDVLALCHDLRPPASFVVVVRPSQGEAVVYCENRLTKNHQILHGHPYQPTLQPQRNDIINHFRVGSYREKTVKMPLLTVSGRISQEQYERERGPPNSTRLSGTIGLINLPDMISLAASGRMQNATKYCTKVRNALAEQD